MVKQNHEDQPWKLCKQHVKIYFYAFGTTAKMKKTDLSSVSIDVEKLELPDITLETAY